MRTFIQKPKANQQPASAKSAIPGRGHFGQSREVNSILHLQRTIGNQAVQRLLQQARSPSYEDKNEEGIDTAGEAEAHAVERAVASGQPARIALKTLDVVEGMRRPALREKRLLALKEDPPPPALTSEDIHLDWFKRHWSSLPNVEARIQNLIRHLLAQKSGPNSKFAFYFGVLPMPVGLTQERGKARLTIATNAAKDFVPWAEKELIDELVRNPLLGAKAWRKQLLEWSIHFESGIHKDFKDRVQSHIMEATAKQAAEKAEERTKTPPHELRRLVDLKVRNVVKDLKQDFDIATEAGVNAWHMPRMPPDMESSAWSSAADIIGAAGAIVAVFFPPTALITGAVAISFAAASAVAGGKAYFSGKQQAQEQYRMQLLEDSIKEAARLGFEQVSDGIEKNLDLLAVICTVEALDNKIDVDRMGADALENFLWPKLFGEKFPRGKEKGRRHVMDEMSKELKRQIPGS